jgi:PucR C-terminal helix-turn-helix domain/GGDEF-like domain
MQASKPRPPHPAHPGGDTPGEPAALRQLSDFRGMLGLSMLMISTADADDILRGAVTAAPSLGGCGVLGIHLGGRWHEAPGLPRPQQPGRLARQLRETGPDGGPLKLSATPWSWSYPLTGLSALLGHAVVGGASEPSVHHQFLLGVLFRETGAAVESAQLRSGLAASASQLQTANTALQRAVAAAEQSMAVLRRSLTIYDRLTQGATAGDGQAGIALALHELTGHRVAIEDRYGNLMAWAGPDRPDPYPKDSAASRARLLHRAQRERGILARRDRLIAVAQPDSSTTLSVIALICPAAAVRDDDRAALEHAARVLALDLVRQRSVADTELRLRRDLAEDLLSGTGLDSAQVRAWALGYDLSQPQRVIIVGGTSRRRARDVLFHAVQRAVRAESTGALVVARSGGVAVLASADLDPWPLRRAVLAGLGPGGSCRIGVGGATADPAGLARSHRQAQLALRLQAATDRPEQVTVFDDMGVYQLLAGVTDIGSVEGFVRRWLGALLDYDEAKGAQFVWTLSAYLECGGSYDVTARKMSLHRSTLRYRLQRIRVISGYDLGDPDTRFNLQLATRAWTTVRAMSRS